MASPLTHNAVYITLNEFNFVALESSQAMLPGIFATSFVLGLSGALMPGPLLTLTVGESVRRGYIAGPLLVLGHALLELLVVILLYFGFGQYLQAPLVFASIAVVGSFLLIWMAYGMFRCQASLSALTAGGATKGGNAVIAGSIVSASNPYFIIWWATIGIGYIVIAQRAGVAGIAAFYSGHVLSDFAWYSLISFSVSLGRRFINERFYSLLIRCCAVFLVAFAIFFCYSGIKHYI